MKHLVLAACLLSLHAIVLADSPTSAPETVYRQYLAAYKAMRGWDDQSIDSFLSKAARQKLSDVRLHPAKKTCKVCPTPEQELRMAKTMRPYPASELRPVISESGGLVTLTYQWREAPGSPNNVGENGSDVSVKVELVKEQGWKLKSESWAAVENPGTAKMTGTMTWSY